METFQVGMLLSTMIEAMAVNAEIEAMKAANLFRQCRGEVIAYDDDAFEEKAQRLWSLSNQAQAQVR